MSGSLTQQQTKPAIVVYKFETNRHFQIGPAAMISQHYSDIENGKRNIVELATNLNIPCTKIFKCVIDCPILKGILA